MVSRGITYVCWGKCIEEAENSARTAKRFGLNTSLIAPEYNGDIFDRFIRTQEKLMHSRQRVFVYHLSPWDETLYLDSDTVILGDLTFGFDMAHKFGIALAIAPACYLKYHWKLEQNDLPAELPDYNAGVIFFNRHHPRMKNLWQMVQEELKNCLQHREQHDYDQLALSLLLYKKEINPYALPQNWNLRPQHGMRNGYGPIKIWHSRNSIPDDFDTQQKGWWTLDKKGV